MTFYQELQLNQAGSKALIRNCETKKEKITHFMIYLFKVLLTVSFCVVFVTAYTKIFGSENSIVGVVVLLSLLVFRAADLGISWTHGFFVLLGLFAVLAFGPRLSNMAGPFGALLINLVCIGSLMIFGCHNVIMSNHSTLVLAYLLLQGYDVTGDLYKKRLIGLGIGAIVIAVVFVYKHRKITYVKKFRDILKEFDIKSTRSKWQIKLTLGVSTVLLLTQLFHLQRGMWAGIAAMSVMLPFRKDLLERVKYRSIGSIMGTALFFLIYILFPESWYGYIGMIGGVCVGFSQTYLWQTVFNSLGALVIAAGMFGLPTALFLRVANNLFGAVYGCLFDKCIK